MSFSPFEATARPLLLWLRDSDIQLSRAEAVMAADSELNGIGVPVGETRLLTPAEWEALRAAIKKHKGTGARKGRARNAKT